MTACRVTRQDATTYRSGSQALRRAKSLDRALRMVSEKRPYVESSSSPRPTRPTRPTGEGGGYRGPQPWVNERHNAQDSGENLSARKFEDSVLLSLIFDCVVFVARGPTVSLSQVTTRNPTTSHPHPHTTKQNSNIRRNTRKEHKSTATDPRTHQIELMKVSNEHRPLVPIRQG